MTAAGPRPGVNSVTLSITPSAIPSMTLCDTDPIARAVPREATARDPWQKGAPMCTAGL